MIPYMSVFRRIVAWLLWRFEGFDNTETAEFEVLLESALDMMRKVVEYYDDSEVASIMRYAADPIRQLRDDLQRTNAVLQDVEHDESVAWDRVRKAEAENATLRQQLADVTESMGRVDERCAKLRELAEKAWKVAEMLCQAWDGPCHADGVSIKPPCPLDERDELCVYGLIQRDLRELGVEVDA